MTVISQTHKNDDRNQMQPQRQKKKNQLQTEKEKARNVHWTVIHDLTKKHTCFRDDESVKLTERLVANLVGINQLSFLPCT